MKKLLVLVLIIFIAGMATFHKDILKFAAYNFVYKYEVQTKQVNEYSRNNDYSFVNKTTNFYPKNRQEILDVIYTAIDAGWLEFSFICDYNYLECENDVKDIANDVDTLTNINNFVNPFNSYDHLNITISGLGKITINVKPLYSKEQIAAINSWVDDVLARKVKDSMTTKAKILIIHDYIINNTYYDKERADAILENRDIINNESHSAYGIVAYGKAVCGGYSDMMMIFLERLGVENFKISSETHVWNAVKHNGKWLHLDLTWDDPTNSKGENILQHTYFLIDTPRLRELDSDKIHIYSEEVFAELK